MQFDKKNVRFMWEDELHGKRVYVGDYIIELMAQVCIDTDTTTVKPSHRPAEYPFHTKGGIFRFVYVVDDKPCDDDGQKEFDFD